MIYGGNIPILFEDGEALIVNKPAGLPSTVRARAAWLWKISSGSAPWLCA
jgi:hypothetical protein